MLFIGIAVSMPVCAEVAFLAHFNVDATGEPASAPTVTLENGAKISAGKLGYPFAGEVTSEALDLGFASADIAAGAQFACPLNDLSTGTIQFWINTGYDWFTPATSKEKWDERSVLCIPVSGGVHYRISVGWYNRFAPWFCFHIYDGKTEKLIGLTPRNAPKGFNSKPGVWHYVVATWTPNNMRMFIDGQLIQEVTLETPFSFPAPGGLVRLGAGPTHYGAKAPVAHALLDELRIDTVALFTDTTMISIPTKPFSIQDTGNGTP
jgi:hypothetical protein